MPGDGGPMPPFGHSSSLARPALGGCIPVLHQNLIGPLDEPPGKMSQYTSPDADTNPIEACVAGSEIAKIANYTAQRTKKVVLVP